MIGARLSCSFPDCFKWITHYLTLQFSLFCTFSSLLLSYSGYLSNSQPCRKNSKRDSRAANHIWSERSKQWLPICEYRVGFTGNNLNFQGELLNAIRKSVIKSKQTDVEFYSSYFQELFFHQLRYQITVKTECSRNQTSPVLPMHLHINPMENYHQTWAHSKDVIHNSVSQENRPYDTSEHPC